MGFIYTPAGIQSLPHEFAKQFVNEGYDILVETGTYDGKNANIAASYFKEVYTIEASEFYYNSAKEHCKNAKNIEILFGKSEGILPALLDKLASKKILFWLDAHHVAGKTPEAPSPLLKELALINASCHEPIIFVDDARFINMEYCGERYASLYDSIVSISFNGTRAVSLLGDVYIATPKHMMHLLKSIDTLYSTKESRKCYLISLPLAKRFLKHPCINKYTKYFTFPAAQKYFDKLRGKNEHTN